MARSQFKEKFPMCLTSIVAGASVADAARQSGVGVRTVERWLEHGRRDPTSVYGPFAEAVDACRAESQLPAADERDELSEAELKRVIAKAARRGNVQAAKLYFETWIKNKAEEVEPDVFDPLQEVDALARKRAAR